jgi:3-hydroxyisobutyrate dehydrogenase
MNKPRIGFIGIGIMGAPMAEHIAAAGYPLAVYDIDGTKSEALAAEQKGAVVSASPRALAEISDIVVTMLPSGIYVRDVVLGSNGVMEGLHAGGLVLDTSSSEPWLTIETAKTLAGACIDMPLFQVMGKNAFHLGPVGSGHAMKCINNLITSVTFMATTEGLTLGKRFGLDPSAMVDVLNLSTGMSWISQTHFKQRIFNRAFDDPFQLELMVKDIGIAMELANSQNHSMPLSSRNKELWQEAASHFEKGASISNMVRWIEDKTGVELMPVSEARRDNRGK